MEKKFGHPASLMGEKLRAEVEKQLLEDLKHYGVNIDHLHFDWSNPCQEGHCTSFLDGNLESSSDVFILDQDGNRMVNGWLDFVHGGDGYPLYVFWLFLDILRNGEWVDVKSDPNIPLHVWEKLPKSSRDACIKKDVYDSIWSDDPRVIDWKKSQNL